ncbi:unnamed protein product [Ambrosiozyma monospora]|uniref:Unnamed protein product n=1 Tax=Ambrosiozyma monospora TaxID=43982 RepID=A0ACB5TJK9_AMBMO|nr:unnamed protein product [Ambrosiozyma monospora]
MEEEDRMLAAKIALEETANEPQDTLEYKIVKTTSHSQASLPSTSKWGTGTGKTVGTKKAQQPIKTLDEIQKEEQAKAAAKARAQAAAARQQSIAASIAKQSFASAATSSSSSGAWTVVASAKKTTKTATPTPTQKTPKTPTTSLNPHLLRSVSATSTQTTEQKPKSSAIITPKSTPASLSPSREFLAWCRSQLQGLYPSVNKDDVLAMILQFPSGADSLEIIADTIYSNSSTMDGRRFSSEFNKRRSKVEEIVKKQGLYFTWTDALNSSASPDNDDNWDMAFTKVVSKKNKRRGGN